MKSKLLVGAAALALVATGVEFTDRSANDRAAFVDPSLMAQSMCGDSAEDARNRRAFFLRLGAAAANEAAAPEIATGAPAQIGDIAYAVTTASRAAQAHFNVGVAHVWNFNHGAAVASFRAAQAADPDCAMCYWGEAFALGPNINAPMADEAVTPAYEALMKAKAAPAASDKERALINALGYRYAETQPEDRAKLDEAFAQAMDDVARQWPDDDFIASLAAEANMDMQVWDYWMADGRTPKGRTARTLSLLETVLARSPSYVPAIHLYIHLTEATRNPHRAAPFADNLGAASPGLGHLIHMPSHTYYRIGRYKESLDSNILAVEADEAFIAGGEAEPIYEFGYYTHNLHMLMASANMAGDRATTLASAMKLDEKLPLDMVEAAPFSQPIKAAVYHVMARHAAPGDILAMEDPGDALPMVQASWRYARGEAYARLGDADAARAEAEAIGAIVTDGDFGESVSETTLGVLNIARLTVIARAAALDGDFATATEAMGEAVVLQETLDYSEPPYWYYPTKQTLAAMTLRQGDAERAAHLFHEALVEAPNNGWAYYGLAEAYRAQGDKSGARLAENLFKKAWAGDRKAIGLEQL